MAGVDKILRNARFLLSAPRVSALPSDQGAEIAFAGRSNVGKSSVINVLTGQKGLAKTSSSPGKTRHINLFALDDRRRLADLPGYGYAKVDAKEQQRWGRELTRYITERECLRGIVIVMDLRHPLTDKDRQMVELALSGERRIHVVLNKADKLKSGRRAEAIRTTKKQLATLAPEASCTAFSVLKREGLKELTHVLENWLG